MVRATKYLSDRNSMDVDEMVKATLEDRKLKLSVKVALVNGVTINLGASNYFWPDQLKIIESKSGRIIQNKKFTL